MEITESQFGEVIVLAPSGRLDQATTPEFQKNLLAIVGARGSAVVIDFTEIPYISSVGLSVRPEMS